MCLGRLQFDTPAKIKFHVHQPAAYQYLICFGCQMLLLKTESCDCGALEVSHCCPLLRCCLTAARCCLTAVSLLPAAPLLSHCCLAAPLLSHCCSLLLRVSAAV